MPLAKIVLAPRTARIVRISAIIFASACLFIGIVLQFYAAGHVFNIPLSTFCYTYSGDERVLSDDQAMMASANISIGLRSPASDLCLKRPSSESAYWKFSRSFQTTSLVNSFISCADRGKVMRGYLKTRRRITDDAGTPYKQGSDAPFLTEDEADAVAAKAEVDCYAQKGGSAFIMAIGPAWTLVAAIICFFALAFHDQTPLHVGHGLCAMVFAVHLMSLWFTSFFASAFISSFCNCAGLDHLSGSDGLGTFYTGQACIDVNSVGNVTMNPFMDLYTLYEECYVAGAAMNMICLLILMAASHALANPENIQATVSQPHHTDNRPLAEAQEEAQDL